MFSPLRSRAKMRPSENLSRVMADGWLSSASEFASTLNDCRDTASLSANQISRCDSGSGLGGKSTFSRRAKNGMVAP